MSDTIYKQHSGLLSPWVDGLRMKKVIAHLSPSMSVLDVGCGSCLLEGFLSRHQPYTGVDRDADVIQENKRRFPQHSFHCFDVCHDPFPFVTGSFDAVVMAAFLEHVSEPQAMLREMARVLKRGGRVVATTPSQAGLSVHDVLSHLGLLSRHAAEEHDACVNLPVLEKLIMGTGLSLTSYQPFQLGMNQLFILTKETA